MISMRPRRPMRGGSLVIWLIEDFNISNEEHQKTLMKLQSTFNEVSIVSDMDECVDLLTDHDERKICIILADTIVQKVMPLIHDIPQLARAYLHCRNEPVYIHWSHGWHKIQGPYTNMMEICRELKVFVKESNRNDISISIIGVNQDFSCQSLDQLDPSFLYTRLLKEILLEIDRSEQQIMKFIQLWRNECINNPTKLKVIAEFERDYCPESSVWWYTKEPYAYQKLNWSLRTLDSSTILKLSFFLCDLHRQIQAFHQEQISLHQGKTITFYRGQELSSDDFAKLKKNNGGLLSFNNFLSASENRTVSLSFIENAWTNSDRIRVLFQMTIDTRSTTVSFASIQKVSTLTRQDEILFPMCTIFRIVNVSKLDKDKPIYQVNLELINESEEKPEWMCWAKRLIELGYCNEVEKLGNALLKQGLSPCSEASIYEMIGFSKAHRGHYELAISFYQKSLDIHEVADPVNDYSYAMTYNIIGFLYKNIGNYQDALEFYDKALNLLRKVLPPSHPHFAASYNNIGEIYRSMGNFSKALKIIDKEIEIWEKILPVNHPLLATCYNNIAVVYQSMGDYSIALEFFNKALKIFEQVLPLNHPHLAAAYNNAGEVFQSMGSYSNALEYFNRAIKIFDEALPLNIPSLATSYNNAAVSHQSMGNYSDALEFFKQALRLFEKASPPNYAHLATSYNNIGTVYYNLGNYSEALEFFDKAFKIREKALSPNHPSLATCHNNTGFVYYITGSYKKALECFDQALKIRENSLLENHPHLASSYNAIGDVYRSTGNYSQAADFFDKALKVCEKALPSNHPSLATLYNNIGRLYQNMNNYSRAAEFFKKALSIVEKSLPLNHPHLATAYNNIASVYYNMNHYSAAMKYYEKGMAIALELLQATHPIVETLLSNIDVVQQKL